MMMTGHTIDHRTGVRTKFRDGAIVSVNRETAAAKVARLIEGAAALRRSDSFGDRANARGFLARARALRTA